MGCFDVRGHEAIFDPGPTEEADQVISHSTPASAQTHRSEMGSVPEARWLYLTTERTRSYTFSSGVVVFRGRRNSMPWQAARSSMARTETKTRKQSMVTSSLASSPWGRNQSRNYQEPPAWAAGFLCSDRMKLP